MADEENTDSKTAKRYEVLVPSPLSRINLGESDSTKLTGPFGYAGISMQTSGSMFTDVAADVMFQTAKGYCGQVAAGWAQFAEAVFLSEVGEYWAHRKMHTVPFLWRFHKVHHSVDQMDWLASARLHPVDRALTASAASRKYSPEHSIVIHPPRHLDHIHNAIVMRSAASFAVLIKL